MVLGFKQLPWKSVIIPSVMPKPDVVALTGGYRRTPILQIGADIYCDTSLICEVLEHKQPGARAVPAAPQGVSRVFAQWADSTLFWTAMACNMQPKGAAALFAKLPPEARAAFGRPQSHEREHDSACARRMPRPPTALSAAHRAHGGEHDFCLAPGPVADFAATTRCGSRACTPSVADVFDHVPAVLKWMTTWPHSAMAAWKNSLRRMPSPWPLASSRCPT